MARSIALLKITFMKKFLLPLLAILLFTACKKADKFTVCHYDVKTGTSKTIEVDQNALAGHLAHGDLKGVCSAVLTTTICDQDWMVKNLDVTTYRNGDPIPQVINPSAWVKLTTGAWCYYNNDLANSSIYGKLYNWYAVNDPRGIAPVGWHVPSYAEWTKLTDCLGGDTYILKSFCIFKSVKYTWRPIPIAKLKRIIIIFYICIKVIKMKLQSIVTI
jgi:hypothetical protein